MPIVGQRNFDYSPDTVTYNIGLGLLNSTAKHFIVQLNVLHSSEKSMST